ncbi:hypothetical protein [uncultured Thermomonospora sp.]|uniref:hypothetical protein n=1 Tax=uncultured Thermomonospora sp. TaxID=671175 RepID=UPI00259BD26D|nr:hypothetical protein [uncultured Thermomonospora sp.]
MGMQGRTHGEVTIAGRQTPEGLTLVTRGLAERGLPELAVTGLPLLLGRGWARLLAALAVRLAACGGDPPGDLTLTPDDVSAIGAAPRPGWSSLTVGLARDGDRLTPVPPPGYDGPPERWYADAVTRVFPTLRG